MHLSQRAGFSLFTLAYAVGGIALAVQMTGTAWDVEWHIAKLEEVFWTPPHAVLYIGLGVVTLATFGGLILRFFGPRPPRGLERGLQVVAVGVLLQFVAGGIDEWWHRTFGIDVALSWPHLVLIAGMFTAGIGLILGLSRLLRAEGFLTSVSPVARRSASAALPLAFFTPQLPLFGIAFFFTYPGFGVDPLIGELWKRGLIVIVFASLVPFIVVAAARIVPWTGGATAVLVAAMVSFYTVAALMGNLTALTVAALPLFLLGIGVFLIPGVAADLILARPWKGTGLFFAVALLGALGGLFSLLQEAPFLDMHFRIIFHHVTNAGFTGGLGTNPPWFIALYGLGGAVGGLIGLTFAKALRSRKGGRRPSLRRKRIRGTPEGASTSHHRSGSSARALDSNRPQGRDRSSRMAAPRGGGPKRMGRQGRDPAYPRDGMIGSESPQIDSG